MSVGVSWVEGKVVGTVEKGFAVQRFEKSVDLTAIEKVFFPTRG